MRQACQNHNVFVMVLGDPMTHDPLCAKSPTGVHYIGVCTCGLIAKVRADEQDKQRHVWTSAIPQPQERRVIR